MDIYIFDTEAIDRRAQFITFDAPLLSFARSINQVTSTGSSISLHGTNFAPYDVTPT